MPTLPGWLQGEHLSSVVLTGQDVSATFVLTDSLTVKSVRGVCRSIELSLDVQHDDIRPVTTRNAHAAIVTDDATVEIELLLTQLGLQPLTDLVYGFDIIKAVWTQGEEVWTGYFCRGTMRTGVVSHGANTARLTLRQVEVNEVAGSVTVAEAA